MSHGTAGSDANPVSNANFAIEIDGFQLTTFEQLEITGGKFAKIADRTGIDPPQKKNSRGQQEAFEIKVVKREREGGHQDILDLYKWVNSGESRTAAFITLEPNGTEIGRRTFKRVVPFGRDESPYNALDESNTVEHTFEFEGTGETVE